MGKYLQGILGPFRGRIGNIIGTFWKGRCIMRIRAANVTNPNTIPQQTQRLKWKLISSYISANSKFINMGFAAVDHSFTAFNNAMKYHLEHAISGVFPTLSIDLTKVKLSLGKLDGIVNAVLTSTVAGTVKIDWDDNSDNEFCMADDQLMVSLMDETTGEMYLSNTGKGRGDGTASIVLPEGWSGRSVQVHAFLVANGIRRVSELSQVSESQHLGMVQVA